jgi:hypothetical protein
MIEISPAVEQNVLGQALFSRKIVAYFWMSPRRSAGADLGGTLEAQAAFLETWCGSHQGEKIAQYSDHHVLRVKSFPAFKQAVLHSVTHHALLVIVKLEKLLLKTAFVDLLKTPGLEFICLDKPLVNHQTLDTVVSYARAQSQQHGQRIREGLGKTTAKLGNPNAALEIQKINKLKIERAIIFALMMQPVVANYEKARLSQRKMVDALNQAGFSAPEGGKWVLSQFQKVLARVKSNEMALLLSAWINAHQQEHYNAQEMIEALNQGLMKPYGASQWNASVIEAAQQRVETLSELFDWYQWVMTAAPWLQAFQSRKISAQDLLDTLIQNQVVLPACLKAPEEPAHWQLAQIHRIFQRIDSQIPKKEWLKAEQLPCYQQMLDRYLAEHHEGAFNNIFGSSVFGQLVDGTVARTFQ